MNRSAFLLLLIAASICLTSASHANVVTGIAATVNGKVITTNEVNFHLAPYREQLSAQMPRKDSQYYSLLKKARNEILDNLIERELILSEFNRNMKGNIPSHAIDKEITRQIRELYNNNRKEFNKSLKESGVTLQQHRRETEKKLIVQAMRAQQFRNAIPPLPNEVKAEFNKNRIKMRDITGDAIEFHKIYIPKGDPANPLINAKTQLQLAERLVKELKNGADFEALAKEHSQDAYATEGGKVEKTKRTDLSPAFAAIMMETPKGKILGPLEDGRGYTIVRLDKKHYGPTPPLSKVRKAIEGRVRARKNKAKHDRWMKRLRQNAMIRKKI
ncbi:MAG: peptidylprolyl isomerase [Akkermansiaceae bacterium]